MRHLIKVISGFLLEGGKLSLKISTCCVIFSLLQRGFEIYFSSFHQLHPVHSYAHYLDSIAAGVATGLGYGMYGPRIRFHALKSSVMIGAGLGVSIACFRALQAKLMNQQ